MKTPPKDSPAPAATARVQVIKHRLRVGDFIHPAGSIIDDMAVEEMKIRAAAGEVELISLNP
jgi:hypothetical protein